MTDARPSVGHWLCLLIALCAGAVIGEAASDQSAPTPTREQIEADWLRQDVVRSSVRPEDDAAGGCDGLKDGKWGFHTALEDDPWWQVDLGAAMPLDHVVVYNRCDGTAGRAALLTVALSEDGKSFTQVYEHDGSTFLGQSDGNPLSVPLGGAEARYVRLQVPGANCLHLDEVEIFRMGEDRNVALGRPESRGALEILRRWLGRYNVVTIADRDEIGRLAAVGRDDNGRPSVDELLDDGIRKAAMQLLHVVTGADR